MEQLEPRHELPTVTEISEALKSGNLSVLPSARELYRKLVGGLTDIQHAVNDDVPPEDSHWYEPFCDLWQQKEQLTDILKNHDPEYFSSGE